jgi:16S rRNA processing protein RimM
MAPAPYVPLGRVVKTHGLKGEVSVKPAADLPFVLPEGLEVWFVPPPSGVRCGRIEDVRRGPKGPLVKVSGIDDITAAQKLVGSEMIAKAEELPAAWTEEPEAEFDAEGLTVTDEVHGLLGEVVEVIETGANEVWVVHGPLGEVLLPVIDQVVLAIDDEARTATVRLLEGLLPGEGETA